MLSFLGRWTFGLLIAYGFAGFISGIVAAVVPASPALTVGRLICPAATTPMVRNERQGKYSSTYLYCQTTEGLVVARYGASFVLLWISAWVPLVLLLHWWLTRPQRR